MVDLSFAFVFTMILAIQMDNDGRFFFCLDDFEPNRLPNIDFTVIDLRLAFS